MDQRKYQKQKRKITKILSNLKQSKGTTGNTTSHKQYFQQPVEGTVQVQASKQAFKRTGTRDLTTALQLDVQAEKAGEQAERAGKGADI